MIYWESCKFIWKCHISDKMLLMFDSIVYPFSVSRTSLSFITYGCTEANLEQYSYFCQGPEAYYRWGKGEPGIVPLDRVFNPGSLAPSQSQVSAIYVHMWKEKLGWCAGESCCFESTHWVGGRLYTTFLTCVSDNMTYLLQVVSWPCVLTEAHGGKNGKLLSVPESDKTIL